ncbi:hypothetical protein BC832DRAFT_561542 [Gaertneriomyces semiglobifer]|nr:hypothetical protein BC832DRAFT_561542 [Gaertneriomyces semiglobifer]
MSTVQARLQYFNSLSGSQTSLQNPSVTSSRTSLHAPRASHRSSQDNVTANVTRSAENVNNGEDAGLPRNVSVQERIKRYGSMGSVNNSYTSSSARMTPASSTGALADIKGRLTTSGTTVRAEKEPTESLSRRTSDARIPAVSSEKNSNQTSQDDLNHVRAIDDELATPGKLVASRKGSKQSSQVDLSRTDASDDKSANAGRLADRLAAYRAATVNGPSSTPVVNKALLNRQNTVATTTPTSKFGATNKCNGCGKTVYAMEQVVIDSNVFHKSCLKCAHCKSTLKMGNLASMNGEYYCKPHFKQLFKLKGNYSEGFGHEDHKKQWLNKEDNTAA